MISALTMMACANLAVAPQLMYHVAMVESNANPFAIGVVGGRLARQPRDLAEAIATARMLETRHYNFSVGIAQVNRANLARYGLDTYEKAFDVCPNLVAGSRILANCYRGAGGAWDKAFSCYYAGDYTTGFRDGYVQKIVASLDEPRNVGAVGPAAAVPVLPDSKSAHPAGAVLPMPRTGASRRVAIRTFVPDAAAGALPAPSGAHPSDLPPAPAFEAEGATGGAYPVATAAAAAAALSAAGTSAPRPDATAAHSIFVPQVTGPNDLHGASRPTLAGTPPAAPTADPADLRHHARDDARVF
ncbi:MAG: lytic transglycosylase domain-containing protein [Rhodanobacteraceae bacterium]